jgi:Zn-dependent protease
MIDLVAQLALSIALAATAIILHELAHGYAAWALGDTTAKRAGRLSLLPWRHVDQFGTLIVPGFLLLSQLLTVGRVLFMFGWAKPVPVDPRGFFSPRRGMALVAIAGPMMNFSLAFLSALVLRDRHLPPEVDLATRGFILLNLMLGIFNLLPIPPLDGGRVAVGLLPLPLARVWARLERYGLLFVLLLVAGPSLLHAVGIEFNPLSDTLGPAVEWATGVVLDLAGVQTGAAGEQ